MGEVGIHQLDLVSQYLGTRPSAIVGSGAVAAWRDGRETPDTAFGRTRGTVRATLASSFGGGYTIAWGADREFELHDVALSVSAVHGKSFRYEGGEYGHVIDPRTGWPTRAAASAVVTGPGSLECDALSTALLVLGADCLPALRSRLPAYDGDVAAAAPAGIPAASSRIRGNIPVLDTFLLARGMLQRTVCPPYFRYSTPPQMSSCATAPRRACAPFGTRTRPPS